MKKLLAGLALAFCAAAANAQSVDRLSIVFDTVYEASGAFAPNLVPVGPGPFDPGPIPPPSLTGYAILSAVPSGTQLTATNTIVLNGSFSTRSGNSPSNGWSVHTFTNATFNLLKAGGNSFFAVDFVTNPSDWPIFIATAANGFLSDHGPAVGYGGTCPYVFGCSSAQPAGNGSGSGAYGLFAPGTQIFDGVGPTFPTLANAGHYPLISGTYSQTNPSSGLGFDNGMDAFAFQGVLDVNNSQGNGASQPYPDGVGGNPGIVRIMITSTTGNTAYMVQGRLIKADLDGDNAADAVDNCLLTPNNGNPGTGAAQLDSNQDGYGNICDADLNNSNLTTSTDFNLLRSVLNQTAGSSALAAAADMNGSGLVTSTDFNLLRARLNTAPGPSGRSCAGTVPCP